MKTDKYGFNRQPFPLMAVAISAILGIGAGMLLANMILRGVCR